HSRISPSLFGPSIQDVLPASCLLGRIAIGHHLPLVYEARTRCDRRGSRPGAVRRARRAAREILGPSRRNRRQARRLAECAASPGRVSAGQGAALFSVRGLLFLAASHLARRSPTPGPTGRGALGERVRAAPDARAPQRSGPPGRDDAARILLLAADALARPQWTGPL